MFAPIKNVIIAGASGSVGAPILSSLLDEPSFNVTILSRSSSSAAFPPGIPVKKVSDAFRVDELTEAFRGQDAVVIALSTASVTKDSEERLPFRLIDAALAAGVKRFIPSEFGANNLDPRARELVPVYNSKGEMLEYLIKKAGASNGKLTWTSISCGSWLDWALDPAKSGNFLGIDIKNRRATVYDSGKARFAVTTSTNTGLAVAKVLLKPYLTENKQIFLANFTTTIPQIVASLEAYMGEKFTVEHEDSSPRFKELKEKFNAGDYSAVFQLLAMSFGADIDIGYDFEEEQEVWNDRLGLPKVELEDVVRKSVALVKGT